MIEEIFEKEREIINQALWKYLKEERIDPRVWEIISYSLLGAGKRLRPALVLWACEAFSKPYSLALKAACGVECLHAFSLVHDDLPGLDDSDLRRGKPALHKAFGVGDAILAGDALFCLGFQWIFENLKDAKVSDAASVLSEVGTFLGLKGLIGGQFDDIEPQERSFQEWLLLYERKTSCLFQLSLTLGSRIAGIDQGQVALLREYGRNLGLAYQLLDDILDSSENKSSLAKFLGMERARELTRDFTQKSLDSLKSFQGNPQKFINLIRYLEFLNG
jgi:geranylgeranyl diphosphate synthase type II